MASAGCWSNSWSDLRRYKWRAGLFAAIFWVLTQTLLKSPLALPSLSTPTCTPPVASFSVSLLPLPPSTVPALMTVRLDDEPEFGSFDVGNVYLIAVSVIITSITKTQQVAYFV